MESLHRFVFDKHLQLALRLDENPPSEMRVAVETTQGDPVEYTLVSLPIYLAARAVEIVGGRGAESTSDRSTATCYTSSGERRMRDGFRKLACVALGVAACARTPAPDERDPTTPPPSDTTVPVPPDTDETPTTDTPDVADTADTADTGAPLAPVDCAAVPSVPVAYAELLSLATGHDLVFDDAGFLYGTDRYENLIQSDYAGDSVPFAAEIGAFHGMDRLPGGDILAKSHDRDDILRVDAGTGGQTVFATDEQGYGLVTAPDGTVWTATYDHGIHRFSADGATKTTVWQGDWVSPRVLDFSPDLARLYFGTYRASDGAVYAIDLDAAMEPLGEPYVYALGVGDGDYHDALTVDACGNVYVANYWDRTLWRIVPAGDPDGDGHPNGTAAPYFEYYHPTTYGHGATFGSGVGGWRTDALYAPLPYSFDSIIVELVIGVPSRTWPGPVILAPVP